MTAPFFFHGLLLLVGLCCPLPITKTSYLYEELYEDPSIDHFQCRKVVLTICNVSITLFKEMAQRSGNGNILFSPIRVIAALSMLSLGAKGNLSKHILEALRLNKTGLPEAEIHKCFRYLLRALHKPEEFSPLKSGSSVFIHQGLTPENKFVEGVKDLYHSDVISINFTDSSRAKTQINNYMMEKSKKEIGDIVKNLESDTFLAVVNYIILNGNFTTYFILPDIGKMKKVEQRLTYPHFRRMRRQLSLRMVDLETPELSLSETHDLESVMSLLGITYAFNGVTNSDSSSVMNDTLPKSLKVISKAMLTHEDKWSKPGKSICFKNDGSVDVGHVQFNRPFLIFIQDTKNDAPLFLGRVVNPKN
ncbi:alpha-1-antitrypsin 1-6-like isoform X2 [Arvicanthis niloticus]|uniref:alpha-1-antitrypsin 1-6-like isoform X2 n=1 Tax=Arvicanthis niloticus TaxID=61156 RepID=UPI0014869F0F|nr:alpha-1-antitrypsin 1-6-like isoform X2 [Arvicanthis niloticus]